MASCPLSFPTARGIRLASLAGAWGVTIATAGAAQSGLPRTSPFLPLGAPVSQVAAGETLEFAGVSTMGAKVDLIIHDKTAKKSRWIPLGETVAGITALRYDSRLEQAVVRANGAEKVLSLRKASGPANTPVPATSNTSSGLTPLPMLITTADPTQFGLPGPATPAADLPPPPPNVPATPAAIAKQETEARMLVSDLLEIGMAQRKAYEDAQRRGLTGPPTDAANPPPVPAPPDGN